MDTIVTALYEEIKTATTLSVIKSGRSRRSMVSIIYPPCVINNV